MKFAIGLVSLLFLSMQLIAQPTFIRGTAPGAEGKTMQVTTSGDLITFWEKSLITTKVDSTGNFSFSLDLSTTIYVTLSINFHSAEFFLEPGKKYNLHISEMKYNDYSEVNPFIQSQNLELTILEPQDQELNQLINQFNGMYNHFLLKNFNALYRDRNKSKIDTLRIELNHVFWMNINPYFTDYLTYKLASLEQLTQYYNPQELARKYFIERPIRYENLEYMDFFNSYFSKYVFTSNFLRKIDFKPLLKGPESYTHLMKALKNDTILRNDQLRELVLLKTLMEFYNTPDFNKDEVLAVISTIVEKSQFPEHNIIAGDMIKLFTKLKPGTPAPDFTLPNRQQKDLSLHSLRGKPVLIFFWTTYCEGCLSEMDLIKSFYDKYHDKITFLGISADKYFSKMLLFVNMKKDYVWDFVNIGDHSEVLKDYDVRSYPLFVLIDKEGNIYKYPADQPSSGLEANLQQLFQE
ncbi:MAG: TlpA family protein disulfide reductase [Bacteroidales bacterium]|nr:TlpA family protein disulfide reductase [Bacteroidales bacterium]